MHEQRVRSRYEAYRNRDSEWALQHVDGQTFQTYKCYRILIIISRVPWGVTAAARGPPQNPQLEEYQQLVIKKIEVGFQLNRSARQLLMEMKLTRMFYHENILEMRSVLLPRSREEMKEIYMVWQMMDANLAEIKNQLEHQHIKFFLYQILRALKYIHSAQVVVRDLNVYNILVDSNCDLAISNFKYAKRLASPFQQDKYLIEVNPSYKAPELFLGYQNYHTAADIWSAGVIFGFMLKKHHIFSLNILQEVSQYVEIPEVGSIKHLSQKGRQILQKIKQEQQGSVSERFDQYFATVGQSGLDLLRKMLVFDPDKRITANEALEHPYFSQLHLEEDEPSCYPLDPLEFQYQLYELTGQQLKDLVYEEIVLRNNQDFKSQYQQKKDTKQSLIRHIFQSHLEQRLCM